MSIVNQRYDGNIDNPAPLASAMVVGRDLGIASAVVEALPREPGGLIGGVIEGSRVRCHAKLWIARARRGEIIDRRAHPKAIKIA